MSIAEFLAYLHRIEITASDDDMRRVYNEKFTISFQGQKVEIDFDAISYFEICKALMHIEAEL